MSRDKISTENMKVMKVGIMALIVIVILSNTLFFVSSMDILGEKNVFSFNGQKNEIQLSESDFSSMALEFINCKYPGKSIEIVSSSPYVPYQETGLSYEYIVLNIVPGEFSQEDTIAVTIRHDTLDIEIGHEQCIKDYEKFRHSLPNYYEKMSELLRNEIIKSNKEDIDDTQFFNIRIIGNDLVIS